MRKCTTCNLEKEDTEFFFRNKKKGIQHHQCKSCKRVLDNKHYKNSSIRRGNIRITAKQIVQRNRDFVNRIKRIAKCTNCGYNKSIYALEFHHTRDKKFNIAILVKSSYSIEVIKKEIRKCIILCANCHRELHNEKEP